MNNDSWERFKLLLERSFLAGWCWVIDRYFLVESPGWLNQWRDGLPLARLTRVGRIKNDLLLAGRITPGCGPINK